MSEEPRLPKPKIPRKKTPKLHPMLKWLRSAGAAAFVFGLSSLLILGWFRPGVVLLNVSFLLVAADLWLEPELRNRLSWRVIGLLVLLTIAALFDWRIAFAKVPLEVSAWETDAEYPPGTTIAGIAWRPQFTEVQVWMSNPTDRSYDDLDIVVRPTNAVAAIAQVSSFPGVSFEDRNQVSARMMDVNLEDKKASVVPLTLLATDAGYRVRCPHLPAKSTLKLVLAIADIKWNPKPQNRQMPIQDQVRDKDYIMRQKFDDFSSYWVGHPEGDVYALRPTATEWMKVEGTYVVWLKPVGIAQKIEIGGRLTITSR